MSANLKKILKDLYALDASLAAHEEELIKIITHLIKTKPDTKFNEAFALTLREKLVQKNILKKENKKNAPLKLFNFTFMKKPIFAFTIAVLFVFLLIPALFLLTQYHAPQKNSRKNTATNEKNINLATLKITSQGQHAFSINPDTSAAGPSSAPDGRGAGGTNIAPNATADSALSAKAAAGFAPGIMPPTISYKFNYKGEDLKLDGEEMGVLKRTKNEDASYELAKTFLSLNIGLVDMSNFKNLRLQNISLIEDRDFGYSLYLNLDEGIITIAENWQKWQSGTEKCRDQKCFDDMRLKLSDVPDGDTIIKIADNFIKEYGIDMSNYGQPEIDDTWRAYYEKDPNIYIPEAISVKYPLIINNKIVYDESGSKYGLMVNVNIRQMKASGIWNLTTQNYQSSSYETEADSAKIIGMAEKGGWRNTIYYLMADQEEPKELSLSTPELAYVKIWNYENNKTEELIVPALIFPIADVTGNEPYLNRKNIIVPLIKELLKESEDTGMNPPMPARTMK